MTETPGAYTINYNLENPYELNGWTKRTERTTCRGPDRTAGQTRGKPGKIRKCPRGTRKIPVQEIEQDKDTENKESGETKE